MFKKFTLAALTLAFSATSSLAATNITWWHGMAGRNGEVINEVSKKFNEAQSACALTPVSKGTYEEALASGIAAFRSGEQPNILQVFDAGAATIINAKGAVIPAEDLIIKAGHNFDRNAFIDGVRYFYADSEGKFVGMPFNSSAPIMYINDEAPEEGRRRSAEDLGRVRGRRPEAEGSRLHPARPVAAHLAVHGELLLPQQHPVRHQQQRLRRRRRH